MCRCVHTAGRLLCLISLNDLKFRWTVCVQVAPPAWPRQWWINSLVVGHKTLKNVFHLLVVTASPVGCVSLTVQNDDRLVCFHVHLPGKQLSLCSHWISVKKRTHKHTFVGKWPEVWEPTWSHIQFAHLQSVEWKSRVNGCWEWTSVRRVYFFSSRTDGVGAFFNFKLCEKNILNTDYSIISLFFHIIGGGGSHLEVHCVVFGKKF